MAKYFVYAGFGYVGCNISELIEADSDEEATQMARETAYSNADAHGFYPDEEHFGDCETVACDFDEETEEYTAEGQLEYYAELYDPEKHDAILPGYYFKK